MKRVVLSVVASLATFPVFAGEPDLSSPAAAARSYLAATKANDLETAKKCWTIDDANTAGALDVVVGMWVESRRLVAAVDGKFGAEGVKLLGRWNRPACTDQAIDRTTERLAAGALTESGQVAKLVIPWQPEDGDAFLRVKAQLVFRKAGDQWRIDGNFFTGAERAAELFGPTKVWPIWRDEMLVMRELTELIDKGQVKTAAEFETELKARVTTLKAKYERKD